ncbi:hypothetical protein M3650_16965 [Paenibacillus sp. MER TA 81-3]|uniref:hypothetical protein n=1 Tax=Paenibacillus sp. MER TA 81-3 TaxID=2939573 RepID=UPI00203CE064|nr:hypothetical protein [Paenibacillus sp. MER TA 81-3]MCM3340291.1 hypothetical protein [Paenibacillus sp. MER TA 81-3]
MQMALHLMEPWLIENQYTKYNLGESGVEDLSLGEILELTSGANVIVPFPAFQILYQAFPFLKDKTISSQHFAVKLVASTEISVLPGKVFERPGHFRVGFGLHPDKFRSAMVLMSEFIASRAWE